MNLLNNNFSQKNNPGFNILKNILESIAINQNIEYELKPNKTPLIDFKRPSLLTNKIIKLPPAVANLEQANTIAHLIGEHYSRISTILGLDLVPDRYTLSVDDLPESMIGGHKGPTGGLDNGKILINQSEFELACLEFSKTSLISRNTINTTLARPYTSFFMIIEFLAHELYHKRQRTFFKEFYKRRVTQYIHGADDFLKYENQIIEIGARAFANRYIYHLKSELSESDTSELSTGLRIYKPFSDPKDSEDYTELLAFYLQNLQLENSLESFKIT